jgi:DNA replication ATP-dependent helicase Dna2
VRRVLAVGTPGVVRLGHDIATADDLKPWRLVARTRERLGLAEEDDIPPEALRETLAGARVVASTAATWAADRYDEVGEPLRVDLAIIDEASQLTIPATLGALRFASRFVLVGDERQLPPLVRSEAAAAQGLGKSLFSRLDEQWGAQATVGLTRQYRMHPVICAFPSTEYYHGQLHAAGDALATLLPLDPAEPDALDYLMLPERPLVFVDVRAMPEERPGKASHAQADVAARVVRTLRRRGLSGSEIGIIAPYRAQVAAIRRRLATNGEHEVTVDTVDRFQGAERSVIILSFGGDAGLAGRTRDFLADPHRLNVALTRARQKLILLGHRDALSRVPALERLIRYAGGLYGGQGGHGRIVVRAPPAAADVAEVAPDVDTSPQLPGPTVTR